jgi:hypothetical protein
MAVTIQSAVATPNRLVILIAAGGAETANFSVANIRAVAIAGSPVDAALAATLGSTDTAAKAQAALITGGSYASAAAGNPTVQSFLNTTISQGLAAAGAPGFGPISAGVCALFSGTNPTLQVSSGALTVAAQEHVLTVQNIHSVIR